MNYGHSESNPTTYAKTRLRPDYFWNADDTGVGRRAATYAVIADRGADTLPFPLSIVAANSRSSAALSPR
jgi:hypothetical protein